MLPPVAEFSSEQTVKQSRSKANGREKVPEGGVERLCDVDVEMWFVWTSMA